MKLVILILSVLVGNALSWGGYKIIFSHEGLQFDENLVNLDVKMKRTDDKVLVNIRAELFEDINDPIIIHVSHYEMVNNEFQNLVNGSVHICNALQRVKAHPVLKIILQEILKASNFPTQCPIKKGVYFMKDFSINDEILPPFLPLGKFISHVRAVRMVNNEEVPIFKVTINLEIDNAKERKTFKLF